MTSIMTLLVVRSDSLAPTFVSWNYGTSSFAGISVGSLFLVGEEHSILALSFFISKSGIFRDGGFFFIGTTGFGISCSYNSVFNKFSLSDGIF